MTVLPADHRADLQKLEKIAGEPALIGDGRGIRVAVSKLREGSDAAIWQPLRFADLHGQKIDPGRLHRFRSGHSHRRHQAQRSWLRADQGASHPASLRLQVKKIGVQCGCGLPLYRARIIFFQLPASRTRGPGALGSNGQVMSVPATTRTTDAPQTTSSTYYSRLNCVMLWCGQRFGSSGFRA